MADEPSEEEEEKKKDKMERLVKAQLLTLYYKICVNKNV